MNRTAKFVAFSLVAIGLTFSYSIFALAVPDDIPHTLFVRMSLWSLTMLVLYALYSRLVNRRSLLLAYGIAIESKVALFIPIVAVALAGLAILSAEPKYNRLDMLCIVGITVVGEEILFRGLLWDIANHLNSDYHFLGLPGTIWMTTLAFGMMHFQYNHFQVNLASITQFAYTFIAGLALGVIRQRTQSIVWSMFVHSGANSLLKLVPAFFANV